MNAKQYLEQYASCQKKILRERENLLRASEKIDTISIDYSGMPHGTDISSKQERYLLELESIIENKSSMINKWTETMLEVQRVVLKVDNPTYLTLLMDRYINGLSWDEVASKLNYSTSHVKGKLHPKALETIKRILENTQ